MESLKISKKPLTGGEQKIEEYVNRIKGGEPKDLIFEGLPEVFKSGIEKRLAELVEGKTEQEMSEIPPQYRGLDSETLDFAKEQRKVEDENKIKEIRKRLDSTADLESKDSDNLEKQVEVTLQNTEPGFSGEIIVNGENYGDFSIRKINDNKAYIHNIQIGYSENAPRNKGYGFEAYKKIINEMRKQKINLISTDFSVSNTSISPQALRVWEKLFSAGYAKKVGEVEAKILDRFGQSNEEVRLIPKYESTE